LPVAEDPEVGDPTVGGEREERSAQPRNPAACGRPAEEHAIALPRGPGLSWPIGGHNIQKSQTVELAAALLELARG
jgi:hypothetical protein